MKNKGSASSLIIARSMGAVYFWGAISIPYLVYRGFSIQEAFGLLGIYSLLVVLLEFPTGVIGDVFGHKFSVKMSFFLGAISMLLLAQDVPKQFYYVQTVLMALSASLISGSDSALLRRISPDFKRDLSRASSLENIIMSATVGAGGFIASIHMALPLYLTALAWLFGGYLIHRIPVGDVRSAKTSGNIFRQAGNSISFVWGNLPLMALILYAMVNSGYLFDVKTIINSAAPQLGIDLRLIGIFVTLSFVSRSLGYHLAGKIEHVRTRDLYIAATVVFASVCLLPPSLLSLTVLALQTGLLAIIRIRTELAINDLVSDHLRASVLSLNNLLARLVSGSYLFFSGYVLQFFDVRYLMAVTVPLYTAAGLGYVYLTKYHAQKNGRK